MRRLDTKKGGKKVAKFSISRVSESQSLLQVTMSFMIQSNMESLLKKSPIVSKLSKVLTSDGILTGPISSNIKKVEPLDIKIPNERRNPMAPRSKGRSLRKDFDNMFGEDL